MTRRLYGGAAQVDERHRHRYEVNPDLIEKIEAEGLIFVGKDETGQRCEIFELEDHPYYVGVQYHPEFKSRGPRNQVHHSLVYSRLQADIQYE